MGWFQDLFTPAPVVDEPAVKLLEVTKTYGGYGMEFYDADKFRPHMPTAETLQIQRNGQAAPVAHYGPGGWKRFRWVMRKPSEVELFRADRNL